MPKWSRKWENKTQHTESIKCRRFRGDGISRLLEKAISCERSRRLVEKLDQGEEPECAGRHAGD